ncbi:MAG: virulence RhuM family protein, partial [Anaeroplasmataceae bacterium]|nr:virulence RhuM family protein [Anaeroplasmataceae bacterium]
MQDTKYELIKFEDGEFSLDVNVSPNEDTVWLTANQIAELLSKDEKTIRKHINNVFKEKEISITNNTQKMRVVGVKQSVSYYSLNVVISVGYRVKSQRGVLFRQWATSILKQYMING